MNKKLLFIMLFLFCMVPHLFAGITGKISGKVTDAETGSHLPAANVIIVGTSIGTATDINGRFIIPGVPLGTYQLTVSYIGYKKKTTNVTLSNANEVVKVNFELEHETVRGETVVITAQAEGQKSAINQQIRADNIKNIISAERIQEIPEASAAEAVGRLPGVSLRDDEMVIRGLSPHYNQIQIDGVDMASTSDEERSSGLGMISQYMLGGIELTKSAMADQEADIIGGTVNLIMKEAPEKPNLSILMENGYNMLSKSYANPKVILNGSNRYYHNLIGVFGQLSFEKGHGATDQMTAVYSEEIVDAKEKMVVESMNLNDTDNLMKNRIGASLVMDYTTSTTKVKFSNFFSTRDSKNNTRFATFASWGINHSINYSQDNITVLNNALKIEHYVGDYKLNAGVAYAYSKNDSPEGVGLAMFDARGMGHIPFFDVHPIDVPGLGNGFNVRGSSAGGIDNTTRCSENSQSSINFDVQKHFDITNWIGIDLKMGGKYKHQAKKYDWTIHSIYFVYDEDWRGLMTELANSGTEWLPNTVDGFEPAEPYNPTPVFAGALLLDEDYREDDFLLGDYSLNNMPDEDKVRYLLDFAKAKGFYWNVMSQSYESDYHGTEDYLGAYIMPQIELFGKLTFNTGVRYERNQTEYTAWRLPMIGFESIRLPHPEIANYDVTRKRKNEFFLPMIHGIYRPNDWFNVKSSYTHTLSRPRFGDFIPKWRIYQRSVLYNDPYLKPALSKNIDLYFSFYGNKLGLFTIGGFKKTIEDLVFDHGIIPLNQLGSPEELTEMFDDLPGDEVIGSTIDWTMNNSRDAYLNGIELEWQSNFWYLPGLLKGLILNVNFTKQSSEAKYPIVDKSQVITGYDTTVVFGQTIIKEILETVYTDTFYTARMIDQADEIFNLTIGYDYKGFSIRASMKYTDDLFRRAEYNENYNEFTKGRYDYDIAIRQKLPVDGLNAYCNITNIGRSKYVAINKGSGRPTVERYGGIGFALGLRYKL